MSTPSITAPSRLPRTGADAHRARTLARRLLRGAQADPVWSRPLLWLIALLAGALTLWGLTRNGYANTYYAEAAQAASRSWTAWLTNAVDVSGYDSVDKGPLSNMLMGLSGRLFGFSSFSMLLPEALCGIASVLLLHNIVRRSLGHRAAILAALMLALTPIFVAMSRFNNPDALLVLMELGAAWALVRALESGRTRHVLLCGLFVGLAFNVKMLQAYLVVPGLGLALLIAGQGRLRRRIAQLAAGACAMIAASFAWYGTMMLLPASQRPWVGDTTDNSWFSLIFGANGLSRVSGTSTGPGGAGSFGGSPGPLRLFNTVLGGQIAWLLPLALAGLALGLWSRRGAARTDRARAAYLLWGGWALVSWAVFSFSQGIFHPYYTTALAPAVAALAGAGLVLLWDRSRRSPGWSAALAFTLLGTTGLAALLLGRTSGFAPWLAPLALALAAVAAAAVMLPHLARGPLPPRARRIAVRVAILAGLAAVLAGPASYSIATVGRTLSGTNPLAGPVTAGQDVGGPPGGPPSGARPPGAPGLAGSRFNPSSRLGALIGGPPTGARAGGASRGMPSGLGAAATKATVSYLKAHQGSARYMVAAVSSSTAASLALQSSKNVIDMGGFNGSDPVPSLTQLQGLIGSGQLHYVLLASRQGPGAFGKSSAAARTRDSWIERHGTLVKIPGATSTAVALYYLT
jgi:4-amino-4-deoxy-L-arabinose transferase-like glycosyltransferase